MPIHDHASPRRPQRDLHPLVPFHRVTDALSSVASCASARFRMLSMLLTTRGGAKAAASAEVDVDAQRRLERVEEGRDNAREAMAVSLAVAREHTHVEGPPLPGGVHARVEAGQIHVIAHCVQRPDL